MKTLIIYKSYHKRNTEKIAKVMVEVMNATLVRAEDVKLEDLTKYDMIGFGSGIYASKFHKSIYKLIEKIPTLNSNIFVFCTSASGKFGDKHIKGKLLEKGCKNIAEFSCFGEFSILGFTVDKKGHPDEKDIESASIFAKGLLANVEFH